MSDVIDGLALGVSAGAFLLSMSAVWYAQRANDIALQDERLKVFNSYLSVKYHLMQKSDAADLTEVLKHIILDRRPLHLFDVSLGESIKRYYHLAFSIADLARVEKSHEEDEKVDDYLKELWELEKRIDEDLEQAMRIGG